MVVVESDTYEAMSREAAQLVADRVWKKPNLVLGLATGSTPLGLYRELIRMHREEGLSESARGRRASRVLRATARVWRT